jgi:hypothetical protein
MHRNALHIFLLAILCTLSAHDVSAQDRALPFFRSPRVALLFHVNGLNLSTYEGGVGIGFRQSDDFYWRASIGIAADHSSYEREKTPASGRSETSTQSSISPSLSVSPMVLLYQDDPAILFISPCLGVGYSRYHATSTNTDSLGTTSSDNTNEKFSLFAGCGLGGGIAITNRIVVTAEYRVTVGYRNEMYADTRREYDAVDLPIVESWWRTISLGYAAILTLQYQL